MIHDLKKELDKLRGKDANDEEDSASTSSKKGKKKAGGDALAEQ